MKFLIAGAGAIGAYMGARMSRAGLDVTLSARGPHLRAMQEHGVQVKSAEGDFKACPKLVAALDEVGTVDVIFLAVKAHQLTDLVPSLPAVLGPETVVVSTQNGVPWWFFQDFPGPWQGLRLERVDPGGAIAEAIEFGRVLGSIVYFSTEIIAPGIIRHNEGNRISLGEPDGTHSQRSRAIAEALIAAGFRAPLSGRIRHEIWVKILGNVAFNPVSALTGATLVQMAEDPEVSALVRKMMREAEAIAQKLGLELPVTIEQRISGAAKVGAHKTSMLQDWEAGRGIELEAVVGAVVELGERLQVPVPHIRAIYACTKLLAACRRSP